MRLAVVQRVCPEYRKALFRALQEQLGQGFRLFIGEDIPESKVRSAPDLGGLNVTRLDTTFLRLGGRVLPLHRGLVRELREFEPDAIICEGESHFLGYLAAAVFRRVYSPKTALLHWCFIALPGEPDNRRDARAMIKAVARHLFDAHLVASSYSRRRLEARGVGGDRIFVATNVSDVNRFSQGAAILGEEKATARQTLGLPAQFTALYSGHLDANKRPDVLLALAGRPEFQDASFVICGDGPLFEQLGERVRREGLRNVRMTGRLSGELSLYYAAADVLVLPGRGGMVMSEAMAAAVPILVHQGDGTEYDLVEQWVTGVLVENGSVEDFANALRQLKQAPERARAMGVAAREKVTRTMNTSNMAAACLRAADYAIRVRRS